MKDKKEIRVKTKEVYNLLKEMIYIGKLAPGNKININQLSREFNISSIPLREALSRLHADNLVILEPNRGYKVSDILNKKQFENLMETRILMEVFAVRKMIRYNNLSFVDDLERITKEMKRMKIGESEEKIIEYYRLDKEFHHLLIKGADNDVLYESYERTNCHLHMARFFLKGYLGQNEAVIEHNEIIEGIRTRDIYRAEAAITTHIQDSGERISRNILT